ERLRERRRHIDGALATAGLDLAALPKRERTAVRDLERVEALRLSLALALLGRPRLVGIDDTDLKLSAAEREEVWELLRSVTGTGVTVLAVCSEPPSDAVVVRTGADRSGGAETDSPAAPTGEEPDDSPATTANAAPEETEPASKTEPTAPATDHEKEADDAIAATGRS
ncbi:ABC transporter ATP-binding protein, partial [Actinospica acidiphila]|nr:ABC transporter ATP-binding protein [Actinospica acidiphila]